MFMIDIETTGLDKAADDILQVAILRLEWEKGLFVPSTHYVQHFPTCKEPSEFAKKSPAQMKLYERCHDLHQQEKSERADFTRGHLCAFLGPKPQIVGLNVVNFDLKFLEEKRYLFESDYHYQVFDVTGVIEFILRAWDLPQDRATRDRIKVKAKELGAATVTMPDGNAHDGFYDCYDQTRELNGYLLAARHDFSVFKA